MALNGHPACFKGCCVGLDENSWVDRCPHYLHENEENSGHHLLRADISEAVAAMDIPPYEGKCPLK